VIDNIGFTGTQKGVTAFQREQVWNILHQLTTFRGHHGQCVGADIDFDQIARNCKGFMGMNIYPSNVFGKQGWCQIDPTRDVVYSPCDPLVRNNKIVGNTNLLIVCPKEDRMIMRSGTWATYRYAKGIGQHIVLILPNGAMFLENDMTTEST
jgi:hypothetical protein